MHELQIKAYELALADIGVKEIKGDKHNSKILEYHKYTTFKATTDEVAWCSAAMNYWIYSAGLKGTDSALARSWLNWGVKIEDPTEGAIVILSRGSSNWSGHVGFYCADSGPSIWVLGGNQRDMVCKAQYSKANILGYRRFSTSNDKVA